MAGHRACSLVYGPSNCDGNFLEKDKGEGAGRGADTHCRHHSPNDRKICFVPFAWEEKPGTPKGGGGGGEEAIAENLSVFDSFMFSFSDHNSSASSSSSSASSFSSKSSAAPRSRKSPCLMQARSGDGCEEEEFRPLTPPPRLLFLPGPSPAPRLKASSGFYGSRLLAAKRRIKAFVLRCLCCGSTGSSSRTSSGSRRRRETDPFLVAMDELREKEEEEKAERGKRRKAVGALSRCISSLMNFRPCDGGRSWKKKKMTKTTTAMAATVAMTTTASRTELLPN